MKEKKEKYRGIDKITGKYVYGEWAPFYGSPAIGLPNGICFIEPGSLERKVGRDKNGREIYRPAREVYKEEVAS